MAVEFKCQGCGAVLTVEAPAGSPIVCPQCKMRQALPDESADAAAGGDAAGEVVIVNRLDLRTIMQAGLPWVLSFAMHAALLLMMAFVVWATAQEAGKKVDPRERIIIPSSVNSSTPGGGLHPGPGEDTLQATQNLTEDGDKGFSAANEIGIGTDTGGAVGELDLIGSSAGEVGRLAAAVGSVGNGIGSGAGGPIAPFSPVASGSGHGPPSQFMGTGGTAFYIVYIIDRSGSMVGSFDYVKKELRRSIEQLQPQQLFQVIFFNAGDPLEFNSADPGSPPAYRLNFATDRTKVKVFSFIESMISTGRTDPRPAFRKALALKPRPNLIYFLTDGAFEPDIADELKKWNSDRKTVINTIAFLQRPAEALLKRIAYENGGKYTFINPEAEAGPGQ